MNLNLGAGESPLPDYLNLDIKNGQQIFPLNMPDGDCDIIRASHVLEHFPDAQIKEVLKDWVRALKPGGWLKIAVPDFDFILKGFTSGNPDGLPLAGYLMGGQVDEHDFHKCLFTRARLEALMREAGLVRIESWTSEISDCAALPVSLNLMGRKPFPNASGRIVGAMSLPRYGPLVTQFAVNRLTAQTGINSSYGFGVFWHHSLTRGLQECLKWTDREGNEADYILTIDYDSLFNAAHVGRLAIYLHDNPEIDVIVPLQAKRNKGGILAGAPEGQMIDLRNELIPINAGHFGLTLFRRRVFEAMPKPWFWERPDANGEWSDGRVDADMGFWRSIEGMGIKAALASRVAIGHIEDVGSWPSFLPDGTVQITYQKIDEWLETNQGPNEKG